MKHLLTKSLISVTLGNDFQFLMHLDTVVKSDTICADSPANSIKQMLIYSKNVHSLQVIHDIEKK